MKENSDQSFTCKLNFRPCLGLHLYFHKILSDYVTTKTRSKCLWKTSPNSLRFYLPILDLIQNICSRDALNYIFFHNCHTCSKCYHYYIYSHDCRTCYRLNPNRIWSMIGNLETIYRRIAKVLLPTHPRISKKQGKGQAECYGQSSHRNEFSEFGISV